MGRRKRTPYTVEPLVLDVPELELELGATIPDVPDLRPPDAVSPRAKVRMRELILEVQRRKFEALKLYEPLPAQARFHMSMARQRIARGGNRSAKTTVAMAELAWAVTGTHPQPGKYPARDGRAIVVAKDLDKVGEVIWRKLGRAGAFKVVKDPDTGDWRACRSDAEAALLKAKYAPPLIPPRMIKDISWESKKTSIPKRVMLHNGWEIAFYSSKSDPFSIQGTDLDIAIFDEEVFHAGWYPEAIARLIDRKGRFWWSATPQTGTQQLYDLHARAEAAAEEGEASPAVEEYFFSIWDNPHLGEEEKKDFAASLDDDERRVRVDGEFALSGRLVYEGYFQPRGEANGVDPFPVPDGWTRFCAIDPGAQRGAVLFAAVPPARPDGSARDDLFGDYVYVYDEIMIKACDAQKLAVRMAQTIGEQTVHTFLIDHHGGRLTEIGSGKLPEQQYKEAFKEHKVSCVTSGHGFTWASDDLSGGVLKVKDFLRPRGDGTSKLRFLKGRVPNLTSQMERYQWKVVNGVVTEKPHARNCDLPDCLRYLCMYPQLRYHKGKPAKPKAASAYEAFSAVRDRMSRRNHREGKTGVTLA